NVTCATSIAQYAAIEALTAAKDAPKMMRHQYKKRRDYVYNRLIQMGLTIEKPTGAFYLFPNVKEAVALSGYETVDDWAKALLEEEKVALVPGTGFGAPNNVRLSYATS
nr:aminotransferase class I/II-fold pyridoxal phosphate-dependent enzyme [Streptococcus oralis]